MWHTLVDRFESAGPTLRDSVSDLTPVQLTTRIKPGEWSILELVIHLADSDSIAIDRMKRIITEDAPVLLYAEESEYVDRLFCHEQSVDDAVALFEIGRRQFARVLRLVSDETFERYGTHNRTGEVTLGSMVKMYADHFDHHFDYLNRKREALLNMD